MNGKELLSKGGDDVHYEEKFRNALEPCIQYIRNSGVGVVSRELTPVDREVYNNDFYGLLTKLGITPRMHWVLLRLNGMRSPREYDMEMTSILVMLEHEVSIINQMWRTTSKIKV